jgi:hypothetical protein
MLMFVALLHCSILYDAQVLNKVDSRMSHPDLRANLNAIIHVRQDLVTHMHRLSEYQNTV